MLYVKLKNMYVSEEYKVSSSKEKDYNINYIKIPCS